MNDIIKILKSLEDSSVLIDWVTEAVKHEIKNKKVDFFVSTFSPFIGASISERVVRTAGRWYVDKNC